MAFLKAGGSDVNSAVMNTIGIFKNVENAVWIALLQQK